jgi:formyltetrahydrofolate hydrolase
MSLTHVCSSGELHCEIPLIISNHPDLKGIADTFGVEFRWVSYKTSPTEGRCAASTHPEVVFLHMGTPLPSCLLASSPRHLPMPTKADKAAQEAALEKLLHEYNIDTIILARSVPVARTRLLTAPIVALSTLMTGTVPLQVHADIQP